MARKSRSTKRRARAGAADSVTTSRRTSTTDKLSLQQCKNIVYFYFLDEGWLPGGTTPENWEAVKMADMEMDDPPLPSDPHLQKKRIALDLQKLFFQLGSQLASPLGELQTGSLTLGNFSVWCESHQGETLNA